jgi:hypothetical protein
MAREKRNQNRSRSAARRLGIRRPEREKVTTSSTPPPHDPPEDLGGNAGVREPRNPKPLPKSGAGAAIPPADPVFLSLIGG